MNKFKMELTWHNCKNCPPEEEANNFLIVSDGDKIFNATWNKSNGYTARYDGVYCIPLPNVVLDDWWWADIAQTVQQTSKFQEVRK